MTVIGKAQTTKQAKASFKARGRPIISEKERKHIERAAELEKRAERIRDLERRKIAAARKKADKDKRGKEEVDQYRLATQRRRDRFGHKSSQFHLGAFLRPVERDSDSYDMIDGDKFQDDDIDDEMLLNAVYRSNLLSNVRDTLTESTRTITGVMASPLPRDDRQGIDLDTRRRDLDFDTGSFWDQLASSTQIAKELEFEDAIACVDSTTSFDSAISFGSGSLGLTVDDLERLDCSKPRRVTLGHLDHSLTPKFKEQPPVSRIMRCTLIQKTVEPVEDHDGSNACFRPDGFVAPQDFGFTQSQLESLIDDEVQLTPASHG